jgi:site-specific recombinase XerD
MASNHCVQYDGRPGDVFETSYCTPQMGGLTWGMTSRPIQPRQTAPMVEPDWMSPFLVSLESDHLASATARGYRYDVRHFLGWYGARHDSPFVLGVLTEQVLVAYRRYMIAADQRPTTINRRLEALRRLGRWACRTGDLDADTLGHVPPMRTIRDRRPGGLTDHEVQALLRTAGTSSHGLAARNYAMVQLILQAGLRVGELAALRLSDITMNARSGNIRVPQGTGLKAREVPLNTIGRRALARYLADRPADDQHAALFLSGRDTAAPVRTIQTVITSLARRARLKRIPVTATTLRHTFAINYLRDNPGQLAELADLLGHESLDMAALYERASDGQPSADPEQP